MKREDSSNSNYNYNREKPYITNRRESNYRSGFIDAPESCMRLNLNILNQGVPSSKFVPSMWMPMSLVDTVKQIDTELARPIQSLLRWVFLKLNF
jgi:hypothetical protein